MEFLERVLLLANDFDITKEQMKELKNKLSVIVSEYDVTPKETSIAIIDDSSKKMLELFLIWKETEGKSSETVKQYRFQLSRLLDNIYKNIDQITENDIFAFLMMYKKQRNVSDKTLNNMRLIYSSFFSWLRDKGYIIKNPMASIGAFTEEKKVKKAFSDIELEKLRTVTDKRQRALVEFLYSTGVRVSELVNLNMSDIDYIGNSCYVHGKGKKERKVYISEVAMFHLREYLNSRKDNNTALFVTAKGDVKRLGKWGIESLLRELGSMLNIHTHPHKFRTTCATNLLKKGMPIEEVKVILGHSKIDTTLIYALIDDSNIKFTHSKLMSA